MLRLFTWLITIFLAVIGTVVALANRQPVLLSADPFSADAPAASIELPLFMPLFGAVLLGMIIGSMVTWWSQGRFRKAARLRRRQIQALERRIADQQTAAAEVTATARIDTTAA